MSTPFRLHDSLGYQLSLAARIQQRRMDDGLRPLGLPRTFWAILVAVGYEDMTQPSDIADHLGIDRTATSRALRRMEADGLISRCDGNGDGRTRAISLTDHGRDVLNRARVVSDRNAAAMTAALTAEERRELHRLLKKLSAGTDDRPTTL